MKKRNPSVGPWSIELGADKRTWGYVRCAMADSKSAHNKAVARVTHSLVSTAESVANLHLIGAAPDLLFACERALEHHPGSPVQDILLKAIKKARGDT